MKKIKISGRSKMLFGVSGVMRRLYLRILLNYFIKVVLHKMDTSIRILVCMSDRKERESIVRLLEGTGFTYVLEASRREEAENSLRTLRCSIVVCDAMHILLSASKT